MSADKAWYTKLFIWIVMAAAIGIDIYWATNAPRGDTISEVTKAYSWRWQMIPVAYGVLTGHLFWSVRGEIPWRKWRIVGLWPVGVALLVGDVMDVADMMPIIPLVPGIVLGRLLWPQAVSAKQALLVWKQ